MKKVASIIIPVYNSEKHLSECIDSVLAQSYKNIEIILVDNGSTDNSRKICEEYKRANKNIKLYKEKKPGASVARALGVKKATGDYILFVDSDDYIATTAVQTIVSTFSKSKADIIRFHGCYYPGGKILEKIDTNGKTLYLSHNEVMDMLVLTDKFSSMCFQAYRKKCFDGIKFNQNISYCEDYLVNQKIHGKNWKVIVIEDILYHYRINPKSTTKTVDHKRLQKNIEERIYACSETIKFIEENISDARTKAIAKGYQIDRIRSDMLKLFSKYNKESDLIYVIDEVFNLKSFNNLLNRISYPSLILYLDSLAPVKRFRKKMAVTAIYDRDVDKIIRAAKIYSGFTAMRVIKMRGRIWM